MRSPKTGSARIGALGLITIGLALSGGATATPTVQELAGVPKAADKSKSDDKNPTAPAATNVSPSDVAGAVRQAQLQRLAGDLTGSARTLGQLVLIAPDDPRVLGEYGKTLTAQGNINDAVAFLGRAIQMQPNDWMLYSALGVAYDEGGNYLAAQGAYTRALTLKPGDPTVLSNLGLSHMLAGDLPGAEQVLTEAARTGDGSSYPKIASNLALVKSLRTSQPSAAATASANMIAGPRPWAGASPQASAAPPQSAQQQAQPQVTIVKAPVQTVTTTPIAPPSALPAATPAPSVTALRNDPTVVMGPIPQDHPDTDKPKASAPPRAITPRTAKLDTAATLASAEPTSLRRSSGD